MRPSKIKIDRSFVPDLPGDEDDRVLVQAIVQLVLALALGIRVVAEGVETEAQRSYLHRIGCGTLQGYLISPPQPAAAGRWLRAFCAAERRCAGAATGAGLRAAAPPARRQARICS